MLGPRGVDLAFPSAFQQAVESVAGEPADVSLVSRVIWKGLNPPARKRAQALAVPPSISLGDATDVPNRTPKKDVSN